MVEAWLLGGAAFVAVWLIAVVPDSLAGRSQATFAAYVGLAPALFVGMATIALVQRLPAGGPTATMARSFGPFIAAGTAVAAASLAWAYGRPPDPVLAVVVVTLLISIVAGQVLLGLDHARLVDQVSHQAALFRDRATRDGLTGLPNRDEFSGRVELALAGPSRGHIAVLFVDLDGFKDVNDSFGHAVGDELLVEAATRLSRDVRERDVVARFGGDEFVALLTDCSDEVALEVAERLRASLSQPYHVAGHEVVVSASIGLARPDAEDDAEAALRNADLALYRAKESGRDRVTVYEPAMHAGVMRRMETAALLRQSLAFDAFTLAFQPVVDLRTGSVHAMEALLRLEGFDLGPRGVAELIETAEETGLMPALGGWVLDSAVQQLAVWRAAGCDVRVAVNVSARQLESPDFVRLVRNTLLCHRVPPSSLVLEITESHFVRDVDASAHELERLREVGVRLALDDFGTGYSSLSYLPRLPIDQLKIDRELVRRVGDARDTVPTVLQLGRDLGLSVVAEGIETPAQLALLRAAGATHGQGHLFAPALDRIRATAVVRAGFIPLPDMSISMDDPDVSDSEIVRAWA